MPPFPTKKLETPSRKRLWILNGSLPASYGCLAFILRERFAADETCLSFWCSAATEETYCSLKWVAELWHTIPLQALDMSVTHDITTIFPGMTTTRLDWCLRARPVRLPVPCRTVGASARKGHRGTFTELECDFERDVCLKMCWLNVCVWL